MEVQEMKKLVIELKDKRHQLHTDFASGKIGWDEYDKKCNTVNIQIDFLESCILCDGNIDDLISGG